MAVPPPNPEYIQTLLDTFKCFICMEKIQDAHLCPHCSKLCCYSCMRRWLTEQRSQCPHCRATLHLHEIVNCRWVEDLSDQLDCLNCSVDTSSIKQNQEQRCETHDEQLTVFCIICNSTICHRCALFDNSAHKGHSFRPIDEIYNETLLEIGESCENLKIKETSIKKDIKEIDQNIQEIKQAKEQKVGEIRTAVECMMIELEKDLSIKLSTLLSQKNLLIIESKQIEEFLQDCDLEVSRMPMSQLINNAPGLKRTISALQTKQAVGLTSVLPDFHSEVIPKFEVGTLIITSFSDKMAQSEPIYSLPIGCHGVSWRLKVYPNGNGIVRDRYLSVFLELTSGPPWICRYDYRVEMINQSNTNNDVIKNVLREFTSDFEIGECWGYNRFFRLDLLNHEGFLQHDSLILKFSVRSPTYYQKCREQQWYLSKLELEKSMFLQQIEEFKQKIPAKVKPVIKEAPSPKKKLKIKIQSLLDEFECAETTEDPNGDNEIQGASGETASNLINPSLSVQALYDNDFQNRFQGETAQSMFERLSRLFQESDNPSSKPSPRHMNTIDDLLPDAADQSDFELEYYLRAKAIEDIQRKSPNKIKAAKNAHMVEQIEYEITEARFRLKKLENAMRNSKSDFANVVASVPFQTNLIGLSESRTDLIRHPTTTGLNNPVVQNIENTDQETTNPSTSNRFLNMSDIAANFDGLISSVYTECPYTDASHTPNNYMDGWETSSSDDEQTLNIEPMDPDHLSKDE